MSCFQATPAWYVVTCGKSMDIYNKNKARRVCRTQPLKSSVRRVVPHRARTGDQVVILRKQSWRTSTNSRQARRVSGKDARFLTPIAAPLVSRPRSSILSPQNYPKTSAIRNLGSVAKTFPALSYDLNQKRLTIT